VKQITHEEIFEIQSLIADMRDALSVLTGETHVEKLAQLVLQKKLRLSGRLFLIGELVRPALEITSEVDRPIIGSLEAIQDGIVRMVFCPTKERLLAVVAEEASGIGASLDTIEQALIHADEQT
jgi:hypothetical protein